MLLSQTDRLLMPLLENNVILPKIQVGGRFSCRGGIFSGKSSHPGEDFKGGNIYFYTGISLNFEDKRVCCALPSSLAIQNLANDNEFQQIRLCCIGGS